MKLMGDTMLNKSEILFFKNNRYFETPKMLQIEITNRCPLNCAQCYKDLDNSRDMPISKFYEIIDEAVPIGVKYIMINGGEPLIHPNFVDIVKKITDSNLSAICYTSGYGMNSSLIEQLKNSSVDIAISLNGSTESIHNMSRDGFDISMAAIKLLYEHNMPFSINWVARHDNLDDFENVITLGRKYKAREIIVVCNKIAYDKRVHSPLSALDYNKLKEIINKDSNEKFITVQNCYNLLAQYVYEMPQSKTNGCSAGITACFITVNGKYAPCSHLYYEEEYSSILEYWKKSNVLKQLRCNETYLLKYCMSCERSNKCRVCRAVSEECHNDFTIGYKECPVYQKKA